MLRLLLITIVGFLSANSAIAQNVGADCNAFAARVMQQQQEASALHCGISSWTQTHAQQIAWCQRANAQQRIAQVDARERALQQCRAKNAQCQAYATQAIADQQRNVSDSCGIGAGNPQWHTDRDRHVAWCMAVDVNQRNALTQARADALRVNCPSTPVTTARYLGCYVDNSARDLTGHQVRLTNMTRSACIRLCREEGYRYAGVQWASYCFCGAQYGRYGRAPEDQCNTPCGGDSTEICGGTWRNSVFDTGLRP